MFIPALSGRAVNMKENRQPEMLRDMIPFVILANLAVIGRFTSRRMTRAAIGADDYMILLGLLLNWGVFAIMLVDLHLGNGKHSQVAPPSNVTKFFKAVFSVSIVYASTITAIKLAILLFYQRLFTTAKFMLATRVVGGIVVLWWFVVVIVQIFSCRPIHGLWDTSIPSTCIDPTLFFIGVAVPNIATDLIMLGLPVQMVWRLQTSLAQKIALTVTFMAGGSVVVASLYRIVKLPATTASDPLWSYTNATIWTSIEPSVGVVSACLPTMRPLLQYILSSRDRLESLAENAQDQARRHGIQLDSNPQKAHRAKALDKDNGINDGTNFQPNNNLPRKTAVSSGKLRPDPERDEMLLVGIHVQQDVQIDRTML